VTPSGRRRSPLGSSSRRRGTRPRYVGIPHTPAQGSELGAQATRARASIGLLLKGRTTCPTDTARCSEHEPNPYKRAYEIWVLAGTQFPYTHERGSVIHLRSPLVGNEPFP
jgi:hypothetical protein